MTYHNFSAYDVHLTENEYQTIKTFCQLLNRYMEDVDSYQEVFNFIDGIAWNGDLGHNKVTVVKEK